jgi:hypothetical protein
MKTFISVLAVTLALAFTIPAKLPRETRGRAYPLRTPLTEKNFLDDPT